MIAIVLLAVDPPDSLIDYYAKMRDENHDIYIILDKPGSHQSRLGMTFVTVDDGECIREGFTLFNPAIKKYGKPSVCSAWEKALYYFSQFNRSYDHIWFVEDDVFIPRPNLICEIDDQYIDQDLLCQSNHKLLDGKSNKWHWWSTFPQDKFSRPWAHSMVCAVRVSSRLLQAVSNFAMSNKDSNKFIEYIFHTIALHNNFIVQVIPELSGVVYRREWTILDVNLNGMFHPVKSVLEQERLRSLLTDNKN